jgi:hypothetical protein
LKKPPSGNPDQNIDPWTNKLKISMPLDGILYTWYYI